MVFVKMLLEENKEKRQSTLFYLKFFVFLCLILVLFTSRVWDIQGCIRSLVSKQMQSLILDIVRIEVHLFTSLVIIAFVIFVISAIIYEILDK